MTTYEIQGATSSRKRAGEHARCVKPTTNGRRVVKKTERTLGIEGMTLKRIKMTVKGEGEKLRNQAQNIILLMNSGASESAGMTRARDTAADCAPDAQNRSPRLARSTENGRAITGKQTSNVRGQGLTPRSSDGVDRLAPTQYDPTAPKDDNEEDQQ